MKGAAIDRGLTALLLAALVLVLPAVSASAAGATGGRLDKAFGNHGRVVLPVTGSLYRGLSVAPYSGSRIVIATSSEAIRLTARGRLDPSFGDDGRIDLPTSVSDRFFPAAIAVDGEGRIVLAGTGTSSLPSTPRPRAVFVQRLLGDGRPDPSFGDGGIVESTFGAPAAAPYEAPSARAGAIALDAKGRTIVTGWLNNGAISCPYYLGGTVLEQVPLGFVSRLTENGRVDPSFGEAGIRTAGASHAGLPLVDRVGRITYLERPALLNCPGRGVARPSRLQGLDPDGAPRRGFNARRSQPLLFARGATQDSKLRTVLVGPALGTNGEGDAEVVRVEPTGWLDEGFGNHGRSVAAIGRADVEAIAVDRRNRVVLAGHADRDFFLRRLNARGKADSRFGLDSTVRTGFGRFRASAEAVVMDSRGRIVAIGTARATEEGTQLALARYLPGSGRHHHRHRHHTRH